MASQHRKYDLLRFIVQALNDDGWSLIYLANTKYHPFRLRIYKENVSHDLRIYVWNLTHGGGTQRPADEYRIQITGVERFENNGVEKTIILGWWNEGGVFAGFDYNKHTGVLGASPSIQIREEALRKAYISGFSTWEKENQEIAIGIRPDLLGSYINNLESIHSFAENQDDLSILDTVSNDPYEVNDTLIDLVSEERQTTILTVQKKIRDNNFRSRVLTCYSASCAFCGIQLKLIEAAHIIPVQYQGTDETSNGISLCSLHHKAYDRKLVTFSEDYTIQVNEPQVEYLTSAKLTGGLDTFIDNLRAVIILPPSVSDRPNVEYIKIANEIRGW